MDTIERSALHDSGIEDVKRTRDIEKGTAEVENCTGTSNLEFMVHLMHM